MRPGSEIRPRLFWLILILTALAGLAVRWYVGARTFVSFDEWQHLFMAGSPRWTDLAFELRTNAHPPLFFLLLGIIVRMGHPAFYRMISVCAGAGSIVAVGLIARRIFTSPAIQLACAVAFALSLDAIAISVEVRSYQLAIFFTLIAFWAWEEQIAGKNAAWTSVVFAVFSSLAVLTHYSAIFFLTACVMVSALFIRSARSWLSFAAPCVVFGIEYVVHAAAQPPQGYLFDFYFGKTPGESLPAFLLRNARNFLNLFSPVEVGSTAIFLLIFAVLAAVAWTLSRRLRTPAGAAILVASLIILEIAAASLVMKYPFGGLLRHQYIAGPFILVAAFAMLDSLLIQLHTPAQYAIACLLAAASIANLAAHGRSLIQYPGAVLLSGEFRAWRNAFPHARAVYLDHWSVIGYFIHTSRQPRAFVQHIPDAALIDEYQTPDGFRIFYNKTDFVIDLKDPALYRSLAACLRSSHIPELTLFMMSPGDAPIAAPDYLKRLAAQNAATSGLTLTSIDIGQTYAIAGFRLQ